MGKFGVFLFNFFVFKILHILCFYRDKNSAQYQVEVVFPIYFFLYLINAVFFFSIMVKYLISLMQLSKYNSHEMKTVLRYRNAIICRTKRSYLMQNLLFNSRSIWSQKYKLRK